MHLEKQRRKTKSETRVDQRWKVDCASRGRVSVRKQDSGLQAMYLEHYGKIGKYSREIIVLGVLCVCLASEMSLCFLI